MSEGIEWINRKLIEEYGLDTELGIPKYRIVWSTSQIEKQFGIHNIFDSSGTIFLRTERGVFEEQKYQGAFVDKWVLEHIKPTRGNPYLEDIVSWSYEPIWIFGAANSNSQPIWRAVVLLIGNVLRGHDINWKPRSPQDLIREEEERMAREKELCKTILRDDSPIMATKLHSGSAVLNAGIPKEIDNGSASDSRD